MYTRRNSPSTSSSVRSLTVSRACIPKLMLLAVPILLARPRDIRRSLRQTTRFPGGAVVKNPKRKFARFLRKPVARFPSRFITRLPERAVVKYPERNVVKFLKKPATRFQNKTANKFSRHT